MRLKVAGNNPLFWGSPDIDALLTLDLKRSLSGALQAKLTGQHDGFPAYEFYVERQRIYEFDPVANDQTPMSLGGIGSGEWSVNVPWQTIQGTSSEQSVAPMDYAMPAMRSSIWK